MTPTQASAEPALQDAAPATPAIRNMTKREVIEYLGRSKRTVETFIAKGRLPAVYFIGPNGKQAWFDKSIVDRLKAELEAPINVRGVPATVSNDTGADTAQNGSTALARIEPVNTLAPLAEAIAATLRAGQPAAAPKAFMDLHAASEYIGLPVRLLARLVREERLAIAYKFAGEVYLRRQDVDALPQAAR